MEKTDLPVGLSGKLFEEIEEFLCSTDAGEQEKKIADMLEVVKGIEIETNHSWAKIERITEEKLGKKVALKMDEF